PLPLENAAAFPLRPFGAVFLAIPEGEEAAVRPGGGHLRLFAAGHVAGRLAQARELTVVGAIPVLLAELGASPWNLRVVAAGELAFTGDAAAGIALPVAAGEGGPAGGALALAFLAGGAAYRLAAEPAPALGARTIYASHVGAPG